MRALPAILVIAICSTSLRSAPTGVPTNTPATVPTTTDRRMPQPPPPDKQLTRPPRAEDKWEIFAENIPAKMRLAGFESQILGRRISYLVYLPPGYEENKTIRFPVIYALPSVAGDCREIGVLAQRLDTMINRKQCLPVIMIAVQGIYGSYYTDARDGGRPIETFLVQEFVPRIDATFRTLPIREARALEGIFMGGYGAAFLGFKYPDTFGVISMFSPPIAPLKWFQQEGPQISRDVWGDDQSYFDAVDPFLIVQRHADRIRGRQKIRIYVGERDPYRIFAEDFHAKLDALKIEHYFEVVPGVGQNRGDLLKALKGNIYPWWAKAFPMEEMFKIAPPPPPLPATQPGS